MVNTFEFFQYLVSVATLMYRASKRGGLTNKGQFEGSWNSTDQGLVQSVLMTAVNPSNLQKSVDMISMLGSYGGILQTYFCSNMQNIMPTCNIIMLTCDKFKSHVNMIILDHPRLEKVRWRLRRRKINCRRLYGRDL